MRIKFTYENGDGVTERDGELLSASTGDGYATRSILYFLVKEDGVDCPKSFRRDRMTDIRTYAERDPIAEALAAAREAFGQAVAKFAELEVAVGEAKK